MNVRIILETSLILEFKAWAFYYKTFETAASFAVKLKTQSTAESNYLNTVFVFSNVL